MCNIVYYVQRNMHQNLQDNLMHKALSIVHVKYSVHCATYHVQYKVLCTIYHVEYTVRNIIYYVQYIYIYALYHTLYHVQHAVIFTMQGAREISRLYSKLCIIRCTQSIILCISYCTQYSILCIVYDDSVHSYIVHSILYYPYACLAPCSMALLKRHKYSRG